jgi:hypothetical protein
VLDAANGVLRRHGEEWAVKASSQVWTGVAAIELGPLGVHLPGIHGTRLVMVDVNARWLLEARRSFAARPRAAVFLVLEELARRLDLAEGRAAPLLGDCAREAIMETYGGPR